MKWLLLVFVSAGCARGAPDPRGSDRQTTGAAAASDCVDVAVGEDSSATQAVFESRECQGGGRTWAGLLRMLLARRGSATPIEDPAAQWTGEVSQFVWSGGATRIALDEEGDAARFCSDSSALLSVVREEVERLRADPAALARALDDADPTEVECTRGDDR